MEQKLIGISTAAFEKKRVNNTVVFAKTVSSILKLYPANITVLVVSDKSNITHNNSADLTSIVWDVVINSLFYLTNANTNTSSSCFVTYRVHYRLNDVNDGMFRGNDTSAYYYLTQRLKSGVEKSTFDSTLSHFGTKKSTVELASATSELPVMFGYKSTSANVDTPITSFDGMGNDNKTVFTPGNIVGIIIGGLLGLSILFCVYGCIRRELLMRRAVRRILAMPNYPRECIPTYELATL